MFGHGSFRNRITEMGFIRGKIVKVIKNAPLQDPVEYEIMGYRIALRHSEAELIEVMPISELPKLKLETDSLDDFKHHRSHHQHNRKRHSKVWRHLFGRKPPHHHSHDAKRAAHTSHEWPGAIRSGNQVINVALVGNPNSGKTSLFNLASGSHERVGNYSGVTVDAKRPASTKDTTHSTWSTCPAPIPSPNIRPKSCMFAPTSCAKCRTW